MLSITYTEFLVTMFGTMVFTVLCFVTTEYSGGNIAFLIGQLPAYRVFDK